ncbi:hypothetical protein AB6A23_15410 [Paenibacillus tarimensis]
MSRVDRIKARDKRERSYFQGESDITARGAAEEQLPSRRVKHPSNKLQNANFFYTILIVLFVALVIGLLLYGQNRME